MQVFVFFKRSPFEQWKEDLRRNSLWREPGFLRHPFSLFHALQLALVAVQTNLIPPHFGKFVGGGAKLSFNEGGKGDGGEGSSNFSDCRSGFDEFVGVHTFILSWISVASRCGS